jgi:hypothetical protein
MKTSESIKEISKALQQFAMLVGTVKKDADNPFFKSKYATLSNLLQEIGVPLQESNLVVTQFPDGMNGLTTRLIHADSGEWMESTHEVNLSKNDPQSSGSAITYMRRYAIQSILCINIEDDDDGNAASKPTKSQSNSNSNETDDRPWLTDKQFEQAKQRILAGESEVLTKLDKAFKMKKAFREELKSITK